MIRAIDIGFEQIYKAAQEITDRETIFVFTSDNGAAIRFRAWGTLDSGSKFGSSTGCNYPLKGQKSSINEAGSLKFLESIFFILILESQFSNFLSLTSEKGGVRVPLLVTSTKRKLKPVKTILNHAIDWFATVLELAQFKDGFEVPHLFVIVPYK